MMVKGVGFFSFLASSGFLGSFASSGFFAAMGLSSGNLLRLVLLYLQSLEITMPPDSGVGRSLGLQQVFHCKQALNRVAERFQSLAAAFFSIYQRDHLDYLTTGLF